MKIRQKIIFAFASATLLIGVAALAWRAHTSVIARGEATRQSLAENFPSIPLLPIFYDRANFYDAQSRVTALKPELGIRAVVVPHHLLASRLVADALKRASGSKYRNIVIVGPNHDNRGLDLVASSAVSYETPFGSVESNEALVSQVRQLFGNRSDYTAFLPEHSVGAMVPTIATDFPQAKIVPIILSSKAGEPESEKLAEWLSELPVDTLVVFSVDFSHYLTQPEAEIKDKETAEAITASDIATISGWGNDHIDSPFTIVTMLKFASKIGAKASIVAHNNANDFLPLPDQSTTSYFEVVVK